MKHIHFQEIIECSSQQSILTGQAGFGIRTFTRGMDAELVRNISEQVNSAYEVAIADQVTADQIAQDANVVKKYPRTLKYTVVNDADGNEKYVVACSTYVGIDYGFFCGLDSARRVGTNYIADILVFDEKPVPALFSTLWEQNVFLPVDNACDAGNRELAKLLAGEPEYLEPRSVDVENPAGGTETVVEAPLADITQQTALLAIALLQTKINRDLQKDKGLQEMVVLAEESKVPSILKDLARMPAELVDGKYFQTNYLQGYGMPNGYRLLFINEFNKEPFYTENYVCVNLNDNETLNVDNDNEFFAQIREAAANNDYRKFSSLVNLVYHMKVEEMYPIEADETTEESTEAPGKEEAAKTKKMNVKALMAKYCKMGNGLMQKIFKKEQRT